MLLSQRLATAVLLCLAVYALVMERYEGMSNASDKMAEKKEKTGSKCNGHASTVILFCAV